MPLPAKQEADMSKASELWVPHCPSCMEGKLILAPANGLTVGIIEKAEVECFNCHRRYTIQQAVKAFYRL